MIGIFDSGIGGLTVVRELFRQLPGYDVVYFGDTARTPYGNKSPETVRRFAVQDAEFLVEQGAKVVLVACNTASAVALDAVQQAVPVPVLGVVTPAVRQVTEQYRPGQAIGVIGTRATVNSGIYTQLIKQSCPRAKIIAQPCPLFVPLVEEGWFRYPEAQAVAKRYLSSLRWPKVHSLILGCTHYPFLKPLIRKVVGTQVQLIDPAQETVRVLAESLPLDDGLCRNLGQRDRHRFFVSDRTDHFADLASRWLGRPVRLTEIRLG